VRHDAVPAIALTLRSLLQVGGRLSDVFDEDPKRWRMLAETLATVGLSLEIATSFSPSESAARPAATLEHGLHARARADASFPWFRPRCCG